MRAARHRLRFVPGVSLSASTYGSSTFGGPLTYGQDATDPLAAYRYRVVPLPAGFPTQPAWIYRHDDIRPPLRMQIVSDIGPLDLTPMTSTFYGTATYGYRTYGGGYAQLLLTPVNGYARASLVLELIPTGFAVDGGLVHNWDPAVDPELPPGMYRVLVRLRFFSGRQLTVPIDDNLQLQVT
jgi:hypothetical protein